MVGGSRTARGVFLPVWAAYPAVGAGVRLEVASRLVGRGTRVTWTVAFLSLVVESPARPPANSTGWSRPRSRAGSSWPRAMRAHACRTRSTPRCASRPWTPKALGKRLRIAPQTTTALLRELRTDHRTEELPGVPAVRLSTERPHAGHQSTGTAIDHATAPRTIVRVETELLARLPLRYRLRRSLGEGRALYRAVVEADLEGIVAKRLTDPSRPTLTRWHKILNQTYSQRHGRAEWFLKREGRYARHHC